MGFMPVSGLLLLASAGRMPGWRPGPALALSALALLIALLQFLLPPVPGPLFPHRISAT